MNNNNYIARYWQKLDKAKIQCHLCPRNCTLSEGMRGFCFVRQNINGELVLTTYGRSSGFCIDPIEKKPLNNFYPGSSVLSFGTAGCNLGCTFCQNWDISKATELDRLTEEASPQEIALAAKVKGCKSVAFTYNEPTIFAEYAIDTAKECHKLGIKTVAVTAGYISEEPRKEFYAHMDAANVDLKAFTNKFYKDFCSVQLQPILDTLIFLKDETNVWVEITNLIIPHENDSEEELNNMCDWIVKNLGDDVPIHFSAFHPSFKLTDHNPTAPSTVINARSIAMSKGIKYVYTGNIYDPKGSSTYCHNCGKKIIAREGYDINEYNLIDTNKCKFCETICKGIFDENLMILDQKE